MKKISSLLLLTFLSALSFAQTGVGIGTLTPKAAFNVAANSTVLFGNDTTGAGSKLMWIPSKHSFRAGVIGPLPGSPDEDGSIWDYDSIGAYSFATGIQNRAKQLGGIAMGGKNLTTGSFGVAIGYNISNKGSHTFVSGYNNTVSGAGFSTVNGGNNIVTNGYNTVSGNENNVSGIYGFTAGYRNISTATEAITLAVESENRGAGSFVTGSRNRANAQYSFTSGVGNITNSFQSAVFGSFNDSIAGSHPADFANYDPLLIVGNGSSEIARSNAMIILKNGLAGFGTNSPDAALHIKRGSGLGFPQLMVEDKFTGFARISFKNANPGYWNIGGYLPEILDPSSSAQFNFNFSGLGPTVFSLKGTGNAVLAGTLSQSSDERLKKNIVPVKNVLPKLTQLNAYTYQWKETARGDDEQIGLLAQEIEKFFPQLVQADSEGLKSVAYSNMVAVLLQAIKELQQQVNELKKMFGEK